MRHGRGLLLGLLTATLLGCTSGPVMHSTAWLDRFRRGALPSGPDAVQIDIALIERPVGDRTLNDKLWSLADEQVIDIDQKALLEDNGFRVGQIGGLPPPELQSLLTSERSCTNARRLTSRAGESKPLALGPELAKCSFRVQRNGEPALVTLEQAQCVLEMTPTLTADGRTKLRFVPMVQHGETRQTVCPAPDHSGFMLHSERATEPYPNLAWEVTLAPNEYVVIGGRYEQRETLGNQYFVRPDEEKPVQRLLVIRTNRAAPPEATVGTEGTAPLAPPLASQASWSTVRGTAH
jgi:hypothetical protein